MKYIAVGINTEEGNVVVVLDDSVTIHLTEDAARKLADDLLRNANHLGSVEEKA